MPQPKIQRAFRSWLDQNHERFAVKIRLGQRAARFWGFSFIGVNAAIRGALTTSEIDIFVEYADEWWDVLLSLDAAPRRAAGGGYFCACCLTEPRRVFSDRPSFWADHLFEPLLEWVNESLAKAEWLALSGDPGYATQARLLADDDPSRPLPGGGCFLSFSIITGEVKLPEGREKQPPILVPIRFD